MTRYKVSFEVEGTYWQTWASGTRKELKLVNGSYWDGLIVVPTDAVIEEIPEPFEAGYYGCYDTTSGELNWLKPFNSAEDLAWSRKWMLKTQEIVPVSISRAQKCQAAEPELAEQTTYVGTLEGFSVGDYVKVKGNTGIGIVAAIKPLHKTRPIHVDIKFSGKFQYAPNQLEHSTATAYKKLSKDD